jgi:NAD(P)H-dependent FMN reductase
MKIYIACHSKELANEAAEELRNVNHEIVSTWHDGEFKSTNKYTFEERAEKAQRDYDQIKECDLLMLISGSDRYAGGKLRQE